MGKQWKQCQTLFFGAPESLQMVTAAMKLKDTYSLEYVQSPLNPKDAIRAYLTNTSQCPGEVGGKGCGSLSGLVPIRPLPQYPQFFCSVADQTVFLTSPIWGEIPNPGNGSGGGFPFGLRLGRGVGTGGVEQRPFGARRDLAQ